jgi:hypothetical protein
MALALLFETYGGCVRRWKGEPLPGGTLLVRTHRHGFGDAIQMARFMPQVKERSGARVLLSVYRPLLRLMEGLPGIDGLIVQEEQEAPADAVVNLMELPVTLDIDADRLPPPTAIPAPAPMPMPELPRSGFRVGLAWAGSPVHTSDGLRSMDPRLLDALAVMPGAELAGRMAWCGLQVPPSQEPPRLPGFTDMSHRMGDFMDTAQVVGQMDLVVAVDTAVAHLAGSLGVPTLLLLQYLPEWRWGLGETTPWYPAMKLLRQQTCGDWGGVVARLAQEIAARLRQRGSE